MRLRLTEVQRLSADQPRCVHGCLELPASVEALDLRYRLLAVDGRGHTVAVLGGQRSSQ